MTDEYKTILHLMGFEEFSHLYVIFTIRNTDGHVTIGILNGHRLQGAWTTQQRFCQFFHVVKSSEVK